jgi:uncharacterized membrane protein
LGLFFVVSRNSWLEVSDTVPENMFRTILHCFISQIQICISTWAGTRFVSYERSIEASLWCWASTVVEAIFSLSISKDNENVCSLLFIRIWLFLCLNIKFSKCYWFQCQSSFCCSGNRFFTVCS